jgi:hypothetical protein
MEYQFGSQRLVVEGDLAVSSILGSTSEEELRRILEIYERIIVQHGRYGCLVFSSAMTQVSPEARQLLARWPHSHACYGVALVGASLAMRTVVGLIMRALYLIGVTKAPTEFFKTEVEARAWLQTCRQQAVAAAPPQHPF